MKFIINLKDLIEFIKIKLNFEINEFLRRSNYRIGNILLWIILGRSKS